MTASSGEKGAAPGDYTDPLVQVAFESWAMAIEANTPELDKPKTIYGFYTGIDDQAVKDKSIWIAGITTTHLAEIFPGASHRKKEDTRWMNQIECYGKSKKEVQTLRDYVLNCLKT